MNMESEENKENKLIIRDKKTLDFINKCIKIHGENCYDYSLTQYVNFKKEIQIICKLHNRQFEQKPKYHVIKKRGCSECIKLIHNVHLKTQEQFIEECVLKHNNKYKYDKVIYKNCRSMITIICKTHGEFEQIAKSHLDGRGCATCAREKTSVIGERLTRDEFIKKAKIVHGEKYKYDKVTYTNNKTIVIIICKIHGEFEQKAGNHLLGRGCHDCACQVTCNNLCNLESSYESDFIKNSTLKFGDKYNFDLIKYVNATSKVTLKCKCGHIFDVAPEIHLKNKESCSKCRGHVADCNEFIEKANSKHQNQYNYKKVIYKNLTTIVEIICNHHGSFFQTPSSHLRGSGCNKCNCTYYSKAQLEWLNFASQQLFINIQHAENDGEHQINNSKYKADGYCKSFNIIFEFHGCYYHGCPTCHPNRDELNEINKKSYTELYNKTQIKRNHCINEGYSYVQIWECEWNRIKNNDELLEEYIANMIDLK